MRRLGGVLFAVLLALAGSSSSANAAGLSPAQLSTAGWTCFVPAAGDVVHCLPPGTSLRPAGSASLSLLVFGTTDPGAAQAPFRGTEHLIRADLYRGQPCPQDPPSRLYTDLRPLLGLPYFACHHYDSAF